MHTIETGELMPGITLTNIKTDKFRTGCLSVNIINGLEREKTAMSVLLTRVLRRGTINYPNMEQAYLLFIKPKRKNHIYRYWYVRTIRVRCRI